MLNQEKIDRFESLLRKTGRENIESLIAFLRKSDFYVAPASTRYHSCHEGGLLEHSLNVFDCLFEKNGSGIWGSHLESVGEDSLILSALLHDVCKSYYYIVEMKNKKVYSETGSKSDSNGRYDWETVPAYTTEDKFPYGHGEKSVMMVEQFIKLKPVERYAIRWHMGFSEPKESWNTLSAAIKMYPLVLALHSSDMESTYLLEKEE